MRVDEDVLDGRPAFEAYARRFAATLRPGDVVALDGPLGSGKTTFVRAVVAARHGSDLAVSSPTFVFRHRYDGSPPIEHLDLYRLDDPAGQLPELGLEEAFAPDRITLIEWAARAAGWLPPHVGVTIAGAGDAPRTVRVERP